MQVTTEAIVAEARSWIGTPYHRGARIKGAGCDCATLIAQVCIDLGLIPEIEIPRESANHFLANDNPIYLETVMKHADEIPEGEVQPGDVVMYRRPGWKIFTHAAIVVDWPSAVVHASVSRGVIMSHGIEGAMRRWERRFFRAKALITE